MESSELSSGENRIALRQLLQNRKFWLEDGNCKKWLQNFSTGAFYNITKNQDNLIKTVGRAPKPLKIQVFWGAPSPQGSYSPYILGDTTRPRHIAYVLVWSKLDQRRLRKTDKPTDTTKIMVTWPWTKNFLTRMLFKQCGCVTSLSVTQS